LKITEIPLCQLIPASWNANQMDEPMLARLQESITHYGIVENLVVRKIADDTFEVISATRGLMPQRSQI